MKKLLFSLLIFAAPALLAGQNTNPELAAHLQKAFEHYPRLVEAQIGVQSAAVRTDIQRAGYRPTVSSQASFQYLDPVAEAEFGAGKFQFQPKDNYNLGLTGSGLLFDFGKTKAQIDKAVAEAGLAQDNQEALKNALAYQVAQLFYSIVFTRKQMSVQTGQLQSLRANEMLTKSKLDNGDALELDYLNAQVARANAENRIADLEATLEKQMALMSMLTGETTTTVTTETFDFQKAEVENAANQNPDLAVAQSRILIAEKEIQVNRKFLRPSINYNTGVGFRNGYQPDIAEFRFNWTVGAGISYPIYVGGRDKKQLKLSELNLLAARSQAQGISETISADLLQAAADQRAAQAKLKTARTIVAQATAALEIAQSRFKNGVATNVDVITAQSNLEQAQLTAISAEYQQCLAGLQTARLKGVHIW